MNVLFGTGDSGEELWRNERSEKVRFGSDGSVEQLRRNDVGMMVLERN